MEEFTAIVTKIADFIWGWPLLVLLLGTHLFFTFRLRFIQRHIFKGICLAFKKENRADGEISQFGALCTSLAATVGTGNIIGVATAVSMGGPGAVFWIWMTGVLGISTKYAESLLSVKYRIKNRNGKFIGGPMYVLERGMRSKFLAVLFALFTILASFGIGSSIQSNSMAAAMDETFGINVWVTAGLACFLTGATMFGGLKAIANVCNRLVPFMVAFYVFGCFFVICLGYETILDSLALIVKSAFTGQAGIGGFVGSTIIMTMRYGVARGLFSNESGLGSAPIVAASAQTKNPVRQALVSSTGTFYDTVIVCALTGLMLVNTGVWKEPLKGVQLTQMAFGMIPVVGSSLLAVGIVTFTFSTILGWSYYAEKATEYLFGGRYIPHYRLFFLTAVFLGAVFSLDLVWSLGDIFNALMAIPNIIALFGLHNEIVFETNKYLWKRNLDAHMGE